MEEKLVEIKTERMRNQNNQKRTVLEQSSVSDSEEPSESSQVSVSDKSTRSAQDLSVKMDKTEEIKKSEPSDSPGSSPERSLTPVATPDDISEEVDVGGKKGKGLKGVIKRKKGKIKNEKSAMFDKTTISYSALVDNESDSEVSSFLLLKVVFDNEIISDFKRLLQKCSIVFGGKSI